MSHCHQGDEVSHLTQHPANDLSSKPDAQAKFFMMRPPKVAFIAPREESRTRNDAVSRVFGSLVTRLTSRGAMKATFVGNVIFRLRVRL